MSPAEAASIFSRCLPRATLSWPIRSSAPVTLFVRESPEAIVPLQTRSQVMSPPCASFCRLKAKATLAPVGEMFERDRIVVTGAVPLERGPDGGRRQQANHRLEQRQHADLAVGGRAEDRENLARGNPGDQPRHHLGLAQAPLLQELLHQRVVGLGRGVQQRLARLRHRVGHVRRRLAHDRLAAGPGVGLLRDQVDDPRERLPFADRQLHRHRGRADPRLDPAHRLREVGVLLVHPVEHDEGRHAMRAQHPPERLAREPRGRRPP